MNDWSCILLKLSNGKKKTAKDFFIPPWKTRGKSRLRCILQYHQVTKIIHERDLNQPIQKCIPQLSGEMLNEDIKLDQWRVLFPPPSMNGIQTHSKIHSQAE